MRTKIFSLILIIILLSLCSSFVNADTVEVKDYIKGKFPLKFAIYLSSLGKLDQNEKEFIDLLEKLPEETQEFYAKEVYNKGFTEDLLKELETIDSEESTIRKYDFRKLSWGVSPKEVKKAEESNLKFEDESIDNKIGRSILYFGNEAGIGCYIRYVFENEKLAEVMLHTVVQHKDKNKHISDYNQWKKFLTNKYGEPIHEIMSWKNKKYKENQEKWGYAILLGHLIYNTKWETSNTNIILALQGTEFANNKQIMLVTHYESKEFKKSK